MTLPDCYPGDHDETGARTEQHDMDLIPVERIFEKARRERWPTSFIDAMANHHLCGGSAQDVADGVGQTREGTPDMSGCPVCGGNHSDGMICTPWPKG